MNIFTATNCPKCKKTVWFNRNRKRLYLNSTNDDDIHECFPEQQHCSICHIEVNDVAGDPGLWPMELEYPNGNGERKTYCRNCVIDAVAAYENKGDC